MMMMIKARMRRTVAGDLGIWQRKSSTFGIGGGRSIWLILEKHTNGVEKGDVLVVYKDNVKRGNWKMAEVTEVVLGRDGQVHGAKVRMI